METYVLDASVGAKWFLSEALSDIAQQVKRQLETNEIRVIVPDLFFIEIGNAFLKRIQKRQIRSSEALRQFDSLMNFKLERYSDHELSDVAFENSVQFKISPYDAIYVSLAEIYVAPLVTADEFLIKACRNKFDFILPLHEFGK